MQSFDKGFERPKKESAGAGALEISGQDIINGVYQETIQKFNAIYIDVVKNIESPIKLTDPTTLPASTGNSVAFSSDNTYLTVGHDSSPFVTIYKRSGDTFTKLTNPAILPTSSGTGVAFSPDVTYLAVSNQFGDRFLTIYKRSGDTFTKLADPATPPAGQSNSVAFTPDDTYLAVVHFTSPFITIYKRLGDTFTKLTNPATLPAAAGNGVAFSATDVYFAVCHGTTPFVTIYKGTVVLTNFGVFKSNNLISNLQDRSGAGYVLKSGVKGDENEVVRLWRDV